MHKARLLINLTGALGQAMEKGPRGALRSEFGDDERVDRVIDQFVTARLLTSDHDDATREPTIEVAHEALLRDWPRLRGWLDEDAVMLEDGNPRGLINIVREQNVDVLIAGGRNMYTALKARVPFLDINQEREFGYAGYTGMLELARQLALTIENPVWEAVRRPSPWAAGNGEDKS